VSLFGELRRRNVFRVGIAYLAAAWLLIQVADVVLSNFATPAWIIQALIFSLALGFPFVLLLAWFYELTPEGVKATADVEPVEAVRFTGRKIDFAIIGVLVVAVGILLVRSPIEDQRSVLPNSVAVLPFENLSPDIDDAYFATGLHDEILNQLAKLSNISVISRTSVLRYQDSDLSIPEIAAELNVGTVMEGSVRYANDRVRITTQLIDAETDEHLWSETYDREFADIFAIESDIAINISSALEAEFSLVERESIEKIPTDSPAAYRFYLAALDLRGGLGDDLLDRAIELDAEFALPYAQKAWRSTSPLVGVGPGASPDDAVELERAVRENAERALVLDPTIGLAHAALGAIHQAQWRGEAAEEELRRAVQLSPNSVEVLVMYGRFKRYRGEYGEAIKLTRRAAELAPNDFYPAIQLFLAYRFAGDWNAAVDAATDEFDLAYAEAARGNSAEALAAVRIAEQSGDYRPFDLAQFAQIYALAGRPGEARRVFGEFVAATEDQPVGDAIWARAYMTIGDYEEALRRVESAVADRVPTDFAALAELAANPWDDPELASPRFRALLDGLWDDK